MVHYDKCTRFSLRMLTYNFLYDDMSDGIFCASQHHEFTRERRDSWLFDVCGIGMSFRDAFSSWKRKSRSTSASLNWLDQPQLFKSTMALLVLWNAEFGRGRL